MRILLFMLLAWLIYNLFYSPVRKRALGDGEGKGEPPKRKKVDSTVVDNDSK